MTAAYKWLAEVSAWWWPRFADHLWQTTLFALVLLAAAFVLKRGPARRRHALCLVAAAKFLVPAALFVLLPQQFGLDARSVFRAPQPAEQHALLLQGIAEPTAAFAANYEVTVVAADTVRPQGVYLTLTAVWLTGSVTMLLLWAIRRRRLRHALRQGRNVCSGREWRALERAREALRRPGTVGLVISPLQLEPAVWRVWRPTVVLPESIACHLDDDELEAIMLHELVHIERRDNLIGNLQLALCALLWFHPLVWFISRKLFDEREQACDEKVLELGLAPEAYASGILKVVRFCFGWRVAGVTGAAGGSNLRRRIENIMSKGNNRRTAGAARLLASALVGLALLILVAAGIYTRPRTVDAAAIETAAVGGNPGEVTTGTELPADQKSGSKTRQLPPPPPPEPAQPTQGADSPAPPPPPQPAQPEQAAQPAQPAQPPQQPAQPVQSAQPAQPPTPPVPAAAVIHGSDKPDKNKPVKDKDKAKEKSKQKIRKGALIEAPRPAYPDEIKEQKIEGTVAVIITIGDDGSVIAAKADSGPAELYAVSEAAARKARFQPTLVDGKPAKVTGVITYNFKLAE